MAELKIGEISKPRFEFRSRLREALREFAEVS